MKLKNDFSPWKISELHLLGWWEKCFNKGIWMKCCVTKDWIYRKHSFYHSANCMPSKKLQEFWKMAFAQLLLINTWAPLTSLISACFPSLSRVLPSRSQLLFPVEQVKKPRKTHIIFLNNMWWTNDRSRNKSLLLWLLHCPISWLAVPWEGRSTLGQWLSIGGAVLMWQCLLGFGFTWNYIQLGNTTKWLLKAVIQLGVISKWRKALEEMFLIVLFTAGPEEQPRSVPASQALCRWVTSGNSSESQWASGKCHFMEGRTKWERMFSKQKYLVMSRTKF